MITNKDLGGLEGTEVYDHAGQRIGTVGQIYLHPRSGDPLWATVRTGSFSFQESFVPLDGARLDAGRLVVAVTGDRVREAPLLDTGGPLEQDDADRLTAHYGLTSGSVSADADTDAHAGAEVGDDAMTRSEERLVAGTRREPVEKVRLRKYLVTEERQITVPVTREEVRLERVPADAPDDPDPVTVDADGAVILHEQRPVVSTETVPVERVRLGKEIVEGEEMVTGEVRKERIEYDGPDLPRGA